MRSFLVKSFAFLLFICMQSAFGQQTNRVTHKICIGEHKQDCEGLEQYGCEYNNGAGVIKIATSLCGGPNSFSGTWSESNVHDGHRCGYKNITFTCPD